MTMSPYYQRVWVGRPKPCTKGVWAHDDNDHILPDLETLKTKPCMKGGWGLDNHDPIYPDSLGRSTQTNNHSLFDVSVHEHILIWCTLLLAE